jgi:hypothetical protein
VVHTAEITLRVPNRRTARGAIEDIIVQYQGIIQEATLDRITFRIAPQHFKAALGQLEEMGEVEESTLRSEDVTDRYMDLELRLEVAEASRQRLLAILGKAEKVKDVLEVERDIRRLTEEIKRMKGLRRVLKNRVALTTITATLREKKQVSIAARRQGGDRFAWMRTVGIERTMREVPIRAPLSGEWSLRRLLLGRAFQLNVAKDRLLPKQFVPLKYTGGELIGSTARDYRLKARMVNMRQKSDLEFWSQALVEELAGGRGYLVEPPVAFELEQKNLEGVAVRTEVSFGGERWAYDLWLIRKTDQPKKILVIDYARRKADAELNMKEIEEAINGVRRRWMF